MFQIQIYRGIMLQIQIYGGKMFQIQIYMEKTFQIKIEVNQKMSRSNSMSVSKLFIWSKTHWENCSYFVFLTVCRYWVYFVFLTVCRYWVSMRMRIRYTDIKISVPQHWLFPSFNSIFCIGKPRESKCSRVLVSNKTVFIQNCDTT